LNFTHDRLGEFAGVSSSLEIVSEAVGEEGVSSVLVFWPYSVFGQNHLCVKDAVNRDSTFVVMSWFEEIQVP
jgi:hypothetical protein